MWQERKDGRASGRVTPQGGTFRINVERRVAARRGHIGGRALEPQRPRTNARQLSPLPFRLQSPPAPRAG
eukprot:2611480-Pyramimonas_sp.AAC.1